MNVLSYRNIRDRFIAYLFEHKRADSSTVRLLHNGTQLADYLNVTRPALSKEINKMIKEGLIRKNKNTVELLKGHLPERYQSGSHD